MSVTRLFDFAHHALYKFPKEDALVTKYNGVWTKTIGQDEESAIVYGMPKVAYELGAVEKQVRLERVAETIIKTAESIR
jgi:chemotaxis response regulator CheB